jgi:hypothetical protein
MCPYNLHSLSLLVHCRPSFRLYVSGVIENNLFCKLTNEVSSVECCRHQTPNAKHKVFKIICFLFHKIIRQGMTLTCLKFILLYNRFSWKLRICFITYAIISLCMTRYIVLSYPSECCIANWPSDDTPKLFREVTISNLAGTGFLSFSQFFSASRSKRLNFVTALPFTYFFFSLRFVILHLFCR